MPRLVGRRSKGSLYVLSAFIVAIAFAGVLKYSGVINIRNLVEQTKIRFHKSSLPAEFSIANLLDKQISA
ncbi:hypothetical protein SD80_021965 [Scytonema tolypothrichoides VB-61278]|nr:hypothetical protein SD80_021965 [Scytonema tolypothrichoides VB-61278]